MMHGPINIRNFTLLSKVLGKERHPMFPKRGPYGKRCPFQKPCEDHDESVGCIKFWKIVDSIRY